MSYSSRLSFSVFKTNFEKLPDWKDLLLDCAEFLIQSEIKSKKTWRLFAADFFKNYLVLLIARWGCEPDVLELPRLKVTNSACFISVVSTLFHSGIWNESIDSLAVMIHQTMDTGYKLSYIRHKISDGYQEYDDVLDLINNHKKRNRIK